MVASEEQGIRALRIPDVLDVIVKSVAVGRTSGRFFIAVAGELDFAEQGPPIGQFVPDKIEIQKLVIWDDGKFEFEGGKLTLPQAISLSIGPVKLSVTAIGFGSHEQEHGGVLRQYSYFTFDGGVSVNPGGVDVSGKGVAFYYTTDNNDLPSGDPAARRLDVFMRIQSIAVDIILPGNATKENAAVLIKGFLSMQEATPPATGSEYIGGVDLSLPKLKMAGSAAMRLNPSVPAFIIDAGLEMATPILLGPDRPRHLRLPRPARHALRRLAPADRPHRHRPLVAVLQKEGRAGQQGRHPGLEVQADRRLLAGRRHLAGDRVRRRPDLFEQDLFPAFAAGGFPAAGPGADPQAADRARHHPGSAPSSR